MEVMVLNYDGRTFTFTREKLSDAMNAVTRLVTETKGEFSYKDAAKVHRMMHDIAWSDHDPHPLAEHSQARCYKVKITLWSTGTTITLTESCRGNKFESMRRLSWKYSEQYGCQWEIDVSVIDDKEATKIINLMHGVFCDE